MSGIVPSRNTAANKTNFRKTERKVPTERKGNENPTGDHKVKNKSISAVKRYLAAFDFDHTVVEQNTDTIIRDLLPPQKLPQELISVGEKQEWILYMATVFRALHAHGITKRMIIGKIQQIPEVPGFVRLLKRLQEKYNLDLIIISDANTIFINEWLKIHGLGNVIKCVFTNIAHFDESDLLVIEPYHYQTQCRLSAPNLCKGQILEQFITLQYLRENILYDRVIYAGDGKNDICPVARLKVPDLACVRSGYSMEKNLTKNHTKIKVLAELVVWKTGFDLLETLEKYLINWQKL